MTDKEIVEYLCGFAAKHPDVKMSYTSVPAPVEPEKHNWVPTIGLIFLFVMFGAEYIRTAWM